MMKKTAASILLLQLTFLLCAQTTDLRSFNEKRLQTNQTAMLVLGGWGLGNLATGAILMGQKEGKGKYFHQMNAGWGAINLGLATFGYLSARKTDPANFDTYETFQAQSNMQKILLFNAGLDVAYIAGGLYLIERSNSTTDKPERLRGFGESLILQGAFLFAFDLGTYLVHNSQNKSLKGLLEGLSFQGNGLRWSKVF